MDQNFKTILGGNLEWHTDPQDKPKYDKDIVVAYTYKKGAMHDPLVDKLFFGDSIYLKDDKRTTFIAWAYIPTSVPAEILAKKIKDREAYEAEHADEIKAKRIAELEAELADLKK